MNGDEVHRLYDDAAALVRLHPEGLAHHLITAVVAVAVQEDMTPPQVLKAAVNGYTDEQWAEVRAEVVRRLEHEL